MTKMTRRGLFGAAVMGSLALGACAKPDSDPADAPTPTDIETDGALFEHGVASGDPLSDRVILWTRVTPQTLGVEKATLQVGWEVKTTDGAIAAKGVVPTSLSRDFTAKVDATGLTPHTEYTYRFWLKAGDGEISSPTGRTKTTAESGSAPVKFGVVSCSNWHFGYFNAYDALSKEEDLDVIIHLGDYLYEYGVEGYGGDVGKRLNRLHQPPHEIVSLDDYRLRHAQYKSDPHLQSAHAAAPWICTWDDHESTNNSYRTGAENHDPETEGSWTDRKQQAIQAYFEWMPIREPEGGIASAVWRSFTFGDVASLHALESRLTGRSDEISWFTELADVEGAVETLAATQQTLDRIGEESRTMLGAQQEDWLAKELKRATEAGKGWQVLANQVVMAEIKFPNMPQKLSSERIAAQDNTFIQRMIPFSVIGAPSNLDSWDGFPAARKRLYAAASAANANLITLTGDTHTEWGNNLIDESNQLIGVEFGCNSITSPGIDQYLVNIPEYGAWTEEANAHVVHHSPEGHGYTLVELSPDRVTGTFVKVSSIATETFSTTRTQLSSGKENGRVTPLVKSS